MSRVRKLSEDERVLWSLVARSATPLKGKPAAEAMPEPPKEEPKAAPLVPVQAAPPSPQPAKKLHIFHSIDDQTRDKLARGRLPIEGRVDLHGMRQDEAHALLLSFLARAYAGGVRYVLVITGKGPGGEGVLKRLVPKWLTTPAFRPLVSSHDHAARNHGGEGAIYIRLRKKGAP